MNIGDFGEMVDNVINNMDNFKEKIGKKIYGRSRQECLDNGICIQCGGEAKEFRNEISAREFKIVVFCQKCQDDFFGVD